MQNNLKSDIGFKSIETEEKEDFVQDDNHNTSGEIEKDIVKERNYQEWFLMSLLSIIFIVAVISSGMAVGYSAILLPQLRNVNGSLYADDEMGSWIASIPAITNPLGAIAGGILMDVIGRKLTLQIQTVITACAWLCIALCQNHTLLIIGRLIGGFASAIGLTAGQIYIAEVSSASMRGIIGCIPFTSSSFGVLLVFILGSTISWRLIAVIAIIPPVLATIMFVVIPDSPDWLIRQGHIKKARKALLWLRGNDVTRVEEEMRLLINKFESEKLQRTQKKSSVWTLLGTSSVLKPLVIINVFTLLHLLSGWMILILYAVEIVSYMEIDNLNEYTVAVLCAGTRFIFTIGAIFVVGFIGRRPIGIYTAVCTAICAYTIAVFLYFDIGKNYFMAFCLFLYVASSTIGFATLPTILAAELFPARLRAASGSVIFFLASILMFGYAKLFPFLRSVLSIEGVFILFGTSSILASALLYATLPETKDKTLLEIEDYFSQDNILWVNRKKKEELYLKEQKVPINV